MEDDDFDEDDVAIELQIKSKSKKDVANARLKKKESMTPSTTSYTVTPKSNDVGVGNMSIVIFGDATSTSSTHWKSSVVLTAPPQEQMSDVQDEFGFQRGIRTPDFIHCSNREGPTSFHKLTNQEPCT